MSTQSWYVNVEIKAEAAKKTDTYLLLSYREKTTIVAEQRPKDMNDTVQNRNNICIDFLKVTLQKPTRNFCVVIHIVKLVSIMDEY